MAVRSSGRKKLSFEILSQSSSFVDYENESLPLHRSNSDSIGDSSCASSRMESNGKRKKRRGSKKRNKSIDFKAIPEGGDGCDGDPAVTSDAGMDLNCSSSGFQDFLDRRSYAGSTTTTVVEEEIVYQNMFNFGELRQRNVNTNLNANGSCENGISESRDANETQAEDNGVEERRSEVRSAENLSPFQEEQLQKAVPNGTKITRLETAGSLDWKQLMAEDPNYLYTEEKSPLKYLIEEMYSGSSLRSTTSLANEKERERVYDAIFRLPWRCEVIIDVGFFVCLNSFLSLLTVMPVRILMMVRRMFKKRQFEKPSSAELSDFGCFVVLACGVTLLERTDISLIYHMIRGQGTIKLYVVYNVLEIFDRLCQNFCGDVIQTLFCSAEELANSTPESLSFWTWRFVSDQALATVAAIFHSFVLLAQAITLSTCIVAHNNALFALLVSNNFAEIKSNVFKRFSKDNIHGLVYADSIERFHISAFLLFVLAQNILEAEGPWFNNFLSNALLVFLCEMLIDIIKHSFLAKFNDIKPIAYSEFLEELCKQTLNIPTEDRKKNLMFVPLAPACVVIRVLTPVYAAHLPYGPLAVRFCWILLMSIVTYVMLTSLKVLIGMGLQKHATWYVNRCRKRKFHLHTD